MYIADTHSDSVWCVWGRDLHSIMYATSQEGLGSPLGTVHTLSDLELSVLCGGVLLPSVCASAFSPSLYHSLPMQALIGDLKYVWLMHLICRRRRCYTLPGISGMC